MLAIGLVNYLKQHLYELWTHGGFRLFKKRLSYKLSGSIQYNNAYVDRIDFSPRFRSIMHGLRMSLSQDSSPSCDYEIIQLFEPGFTESGIQIVLFRSNLAEYPLTKEISVSIQEQESESINSKESSMINTKTYSIVLYSASNRVGEIMDYIDKAEKEYEAANELKNQRQTVLELSYFDKDVSFPLPYYRKVPFDTTKSFDNLFFEQKAMLLRKLDYFMKNESRYRQLGIPYTMGMLLYGEAGTGKTSCIKSIAKYTGRHIISIPMKHVRTIAQLKTIFVGEFINDMKIPANKRLYVFEEIDCSEWRDVVMSRTLKETCGSADASGCTGGGGAGGPGNDIVALIETLVGQQQLANSKSVMGPQPSPQHNHKSKDEKLNLGELLELLDGVIEIPGRMIIMTTNHPEILDPALLRPGRIDMKIEFKRMIRSDIAAMYKLWFDRDMPSRVLEKVKDYKFTQAEIGELFSSLDQDHIYRTLTAAAKV